MITAELIDVTNKDWAETLPQVCESIGFVRMDENVVRELKNRLSSEISQIVVEFPYRDFDFSSTYSMFYTKNTSGSVGKVFGCIFLGIKFIKPATTDL